MISEILLTHYGLETIEELHSLILSNPAEMEKIIVSITLTGIICDMMNIK